MIPNDLTKTMNERMTETIGDLFKELEGDAKGKNKIIKDIFSSCVLTEDQAELTQFLEGKGITGLHEKSISNLTYLQQLYKNPDSAKLSEIEGNQKAVDGFRKKMDLKFGVERKDAKRKAADIGKAQIPAHPEQPPPAAAAKIPSWALESAPQKGRQPSPTAGDEELADDLQELEVSEGEQVKPAAAKQGGRLQIGGGSSRGGISIGGGRSAQVGGITVMGEGDVNIVGNVNVGRVVRAQNVKQDVQIQWPPQEFPAQWPLFQDVPPPSTTTFMNPGFYNFGTVFQGGGVIHGGGRIDQPGVHHAPGSVSMNFGTVIRGDTYVGTGEGDFVVRGGRAPKVEPKQAAVGGTIEIPNNTYGRTIEGHPGQTIRLGNNCYNNQITGNPDNVIIGNNCYNITLPKGVKHSLGRNCYNISYR